MKLRSKNYPFQFVDFNIWAHVHIQSIYYMFFIFFPNKSKITGFKIWESRLFIYTGINHLEKLPGGLKCQLFFSHEINGEHLDFLSEFRFDFKKV